MDVYNKKVNPNKDKLYTALEKKIHTTDGVSTDEVLGVLSKLTQLMRSEKDTEEASLLVECTKNNYGVGCGIHSAIKDCVYIQTHYYVEPFGCTGGAYWTDGEGQFICPHCYHVNRLTCWPEGRKHIQKLKRLFKEVKDTHD